MPYTITWEPRGVYAKFNGRCTIKDLKAVFIKIGGDYRYDSLRFVILDYLDVEHQNLTEAEAEEAAAIDIGMTFTNPRVVFASISSDKRILELWRHFVSVNVLKHRHGIVPGVTEARAWIAEQLSALAMQERA